MGISMISDFLPPLTVIFVQFFLIYFFLTSMGFLLFRLDIPEVARLFRGVFNVYFQMVGFTSLVATAAFAASGRFGFTVEMLLLATAAITARARVLHCIDAQQVAWRMGDTAAMRRLRVIHWGVMLANMAILASVAGSMRHVL
jgi:hypothetical protein